MDAVFKLCKLSRSSLYMGAGYYQSSALCSLFEQFPACQKWFCLYARYSFYKGSTASDGKPFSLLNRPPEGNGEPLKLGIADSIYDNFLPVFR